MLSSQSRFQASLLYSEISFLAPATGRPSIVAAVAKMKNVGLRTTHAPLCSGSRASAQLTIRMAALRQHMLSSGINNLLFGAMFRIERYARTCIFGLPHLYLLFADISHLTIHHDLT